MSDVELVIMAIWFAGTAVLFGWWANDMRQALNNLTPAARFSDYTKAGYFGFRFHARAIKPEKLTELGRIHREKAIRKERIILVWTTTGFLLLVAVGYYLHPR